MKYVILGGTGTLGQELTSQILKKGPGNQIVIFSRDELKQKEMASKFKGSPVVFMLGDIRDKDRLEQGLHGAHTVFHVAALKHVDSMEENPEESVKTNVLGTINVADAAIRCGVKHVVFSSTDKAVDPINVYGMSKGISEKVLFNRNRVQSTTQFSVFRWGNVLGSRGSIIPVFVNQIKNNLPIPLTDKDMSRFWIRIEDAVKFMLLTYEGASSSSVMIPPIRSAFVKDVASTIALLLNKDEPVFQDVGIRKGEKLHEVLRSSHDGAEGFNSQFALMDKSELSQMISMELNN